MVEFILFLLFLLTAYAAASPYLYRRAKLDETPEAESPLYFKLFQLKMLSMDFASGRMEEDEYLTLKQSLEKEALELLEERKAWQKKLEQKKKEILDTQWLCSRCLTFNSKDNRTCRCGAGSS